MNIYGKYIDKLHNMPTPGGQGCHPFLLSAANYGVLAGIPAEVIFADIRASIPYGKRKVSDNEINDAINRAIKDNVNITLPDGQKYKRYFTPKSKPPINDGVATLRRIIEQSNIRDEVDLRESSPIRIDWSPEEDTARFLSALFAPYDLIFIGKHLEPGTIGQNIRTATDWIAYFNNGGTTAPFLIINALNGLHAEKKSGNGLTYRGDANVLTFRYCMAEFDNLNREDQIRFWATVKLPVVCLVDSGGKSIHAWIKLTDTNSAEDWQREIKQKLYEQYLIPLGVDSACSNPTRLSRLPGHLRDTGNFQRVLWLAAPEKDDL